LKVMIIGSGGREHCIAWKVKQNKEVDRIFCVPGNGGMSEIGECVALSSFKDMLSFAKEKEIDLVLVGPEAPLAQGIVDLFRENGINIVGPTQKAAMLESSKAFAKNFMEKYSIPTAPFRIFDSYQQATEYLQATHNYPIVIKADGLAAGKGVSIVNDFAEAKNALWELMVQKKFGEAGKRVVIEDFLKGEEITVMAVYDGKTYLRLPVSQDHKKVGEGETGPNTGGMGSYSPVPSAEETLLQRIDREIFQPLVEGIQKEKLDYRGIIYAGLLIDSQKRPFVLEFNVRLGDPETQVVLPRIVNDWVEIQTAIIDQKLHSLKIKEDERAALCVVLASKGYPGNYETGKIISGLEAFQNLPEDEVLVFHAGTKKQDNLFLTSGGRVLNVCSRDKTLEKAAAKAYQAVKKIHFEDMYYRKDIGWRAFKNQNLEN